MNRKFLRPFVPVGAVAALVLTMPGSVAAAGIIAQAHEQFTDTSPANICGIDGIDVFQAVFNFKDFSDGTFINNLTVNETFTATASQKSIVIRTAEQFTRRSGPIENADGSVTFLVTFKGLFEQLKITNGPVLSTDAGSITIANTFAPDADGNYNFVSSEFVVVNGPHPEALSDFAIFCDVLVPALT